jgi:rRNA maturation RNase YbeY
MTTPPAFRFSLAVQYASDAQNLPTRAQFQRWVKIALQREANIALRIVDKAEGRELNNIYRGKDYATNVLTFVYDDVQPRHDEVEPSDEATEKTTSHLTNPAKNAGQVIGYSHSTRLSKDASRAAGYGSGGAAGRLLPQLADSAITSDSASVIGSPSRMARSSISSVSQPQPLSGDIVICAPVVEREAATQCKELLAHYAHLTLHATLHLQGYEHENDADAAEMEALEIALMLKLRYPDPYRT